MAGYSNGGALTLHYATSSLLTGKQRPPDQIILYSPAVAVSKFARASNWHKLFSWIPAFEQSKWLSIQPEFDPYKFNSFTKNAGAQIHYLSLALQANIKLLSQIEHFVEHLSNKIVNDQG